MTIKALSSRLIYENRWLRLREDRIERPDGSPGIYAVLEKPDFAVIAPIGQDCIHLVQQYRYPVAGRYWELPQGSWEGVDNVDPLELARGELREETGLMAERIEAVGHIFEAYGYSNQGFHLYLATGLTQSAQNLDAEEQDLVTASFSFAEVKRMILTGEIKDATTIAAFGLLHIKGLLSL
jgi:ADP-ribose pyrophosphatase